MPSNSMFTQVLQGGHEQLIGLVQEVKEKCSVV